MLGYQSAEDQLGGVVPPPSGLTGLGKGAIGHARSSLTKAGWPRSVKPGRTASSRKPALSSAAREHMSDFLDNRRRKAGWRASHRGTKELDILIGRYAGAMLAAMDDTELGHFEAFLCTADPDLQSWLLTPGTTPDAMFAALVAEIRTFHGLAGLEGSKHDAEA